jgi:hypothetical protein
MLTFPLVHRNTQNKYRYKNKGKVKGKDDPVFN